MRTTRTRTIRIRISKDEEEAFDKVLPDLEAAFDNVLPDHWMSETTADGKASAPKRVREAFEAEGGVA